jgi:putative membrane protein
VKSQHPFLALLLRWSVLALGVVLATKLLGGIHCDDRVTLVLVVLLLSLFNAVLKPLLVIFTLPFILFTMGLGILVINAILFMLVAYLLEGFTVASFWWALGGATIVSVTNLVVTLLLTGGVKGRITVQTSRSRDPRDPPRRGGGDGGGVIDV